MNWQDYLSDLRMWWRNLPRMARWFAYAAAAIIVIGTLANVAG